MRQNVTDYTGVTWNRGVGKPLRRPYDALGGHNRRKRECAECIWGVQIAPGVCKLPHQYVVFALSRVLRVSLSLYIQSIPANRSGPVPFGT